MKKHFVILAVALVLILGLTAGCGAIASTDDAKAIVDEYYDAYSDEDFDDIVDLCHSSLIDDAGGEDNLEAALANRFAYYGEVDDYSFTGTSFEASGGVIEYELTVQAEYDDRSILTDSFILLKKNDKITIIGIDLE